MIDNAKPRVAVVTGAGKGIGKAIAVAFAKKGIIPVVLDIDGKTGAETAAELRSYGVEASFFKTDVSKPAELEAAFAAAVAAHGSVDILVNNAGILSKAPVEEVEEAEWDRVMAINLKSAAFAMQNALKLMKAKGWGRIISVSSLAGRMGGYSTGVAYSTSKAAILGLTMCVARKAAPFGVTVNAVAPGTTDTELAKGFTPDELAALTKNIPVGRLIRPESIAETVCFLASDAAEFITGAVVDVNGGMFMG